MKKSQKLLGLLVVVGLIISLFPLNTTVATRFTGSISSNPSAIVTDGLTDISDNLSAYNTGVTAEHTIAFTTATSIPVGGKIEITFAKAGTFDISTIVDADVTESLTAGAADWSVSDQVLTGTITGAAVTAGAQSVGVGTVGSHDPTNPSMAGTYAIYITTKNASGAVLDNGYVLVNIGGGTSVAVTVKTYISVTISDQGSDGVQFGDVDPNTTDNPDVAQSTADSTTPSVTITAGSENNASIKVQGYLDADWSGTWPAANTYYALDTYDGTKVSYTTSPADIKTGIAASGTAKLWHFITVPSGEPSGPAQNTLYYEASPG